LFEKWYENKTPLIRAKTLKAILRAISISPENLKDGSIIPLNSQGEPLTKFLSTFKPLVKNLEEIIPKMELRNDFEGIEMDEYVAEEIGIHMGDGMMNVYFNKRGKGYI